MRLRPQEVRMLVCFRSAKTIEVNNLFFVDATLE